MDIRRQRPEPLTFRRSILLSSRFFNRIDRNGSQVFCFEETRRVLSLKSLDTGNHGIKPSEEPLSRMIFVGGSRELVLYEHFVLVNRIDRLKIDTLCDSDLRLFRNLN